MGGVLFVNFSFPHNEIWVKGGASPMVVSRTNTSLPEGPGGRLPTVLM